MQVKCFLFAEGRVLNQSLECAIEIGFGLTLFVNYHIDPGLLFIERSAQSSLPQFLDQP